MASHYNIFESRRWLARVRKGDLGPSSTVGAAVFIDTNHLLTCAHVVIDAGARPGKKVWVDFPQINGSQAMQAEVLEMGWVEPPSLHEPQTGLDCALLYLRSAPDGAEPMQLAARRYFSGLSVKAYGFPEAFPDGDAADGFFRHRVGQSWVKLVSDVGGSFEKGFSGAAGWSPELGATIAMIVARRKESDVISYAIPLPEIAENMPPLSAVLTRAESSLDWLDQVPAGLLGDVLDFTHLIEDRTSNFAGRDWLFEACDARMQEHDRGYILIRGEPGIGKSAIMARMVEKHGWAHHFNIAPENLRSPERFHRNICAQLIVRYNLHYETLPQGVASNSLFLNKLLELAAAKSDDPVVLVVDALDEAETPEPGVNRLFLPSTLPPNVYIFATIRTNVEEHIDSPHRCAPIDLTEDSQNNLRDIERYIRSWLEQRARPQDVILSPWQNDREAFVKEAVQSSEGNFMYLRHILPALEAGHLTTFEGEQIKTKLPKGLVGYYKRHWSTMEATDPQRFARLHKPVLAYLAIAREAVSASNIAGWINESSELFPTTAFEVEDLFDEWREFLQESSAGQTRYRLYHQSFLDFLDQHLDLGRYRRLQAKVLRDRVDWPD